MRTLRLLVFLIALSIIIAVGCSSIFIRNQVTEQEILDQVTEKCNRFYKDDPRLITMCIEALFENEKKMKGIK